MTISVRDQNGAFNLNSDMISFLTPPNSGVRSYTRAYQGTGPGKIYLYPGKTPQ